MTSISQALGNLTVREKLELSNLLSRNPELVSYFEKLFYEKLEAAEGHVYIRHGFS